MADNKRVKIMIIDDDLNSLHSLNRALSLHGYITDYFDNPFEALKSYQSKSYDVVLTDYKMPSMDGLSLTKAIRGIDPKAKIIMFSGYIDAALLDKATALNIEAIYHKPLPLESFLNKLENLVSLKQESTDSPYDENLSL